MMSRGIVLNFNGKRSAQEIGKRVQPQQTLIKKELAAGSPKDHYTK
jgi:hypothetical protein